MADALIVDAVGTPRGMDKVGKGGLAAGFDTSVSGIALDRFCGGRISAVCIGAASVMAGMEDSLGRAGLTKDDIDVWEINEAFAVVAEQFWSARAGVMAWSPCALPAEWRLRSSSNGFE